jgi:hypothetical protein
VALAVTAETYPVTLASQHGRVEELIYGSQFGILAAEDGFLLLKRGLADAYEFPETFFSFARLEAEEADPFQPLRADFGALELVGYELIPQPVIATDDPPLIVETYWRVSETPDRAYHPALYFVRADGAIAWAYGGGTATTLYFPTYRWQPGDLIRVRFPPHQTTGLRQLYLGVVRWSGDPFRADDRLPIRAAEAGLIEENTLLRLADLP